MQVRGQRQVVEIAPGSRLALAGHQPRQADKLLVQLLEIARAEPCACSIARSATGMSGPFA